jgi:hypothetical protein
MPTRVFVRCLLALLALSACSDPVRSHLIDSLGGEAAGVPEGPDHRPGQPCVACHGGDGPADAVFSFGGTVYQDQIGAVPAPDVIVRITDDKGKVHDTGTNCVGNFFVRETDFKPNFPVGVKLVFGVKDGQPLSVHMGSPIYREGSCEACHFDPAGTDTYGHVYLATMPLGLPPSPSCP